MPGVECHGIRVHVIEAVVSGGHADNFHSKSKRLTTAARVEIFHETRHGLAGWGLVEAHGNILLGLGPELSRHHAEVNPVRPPELKRGFGCVLVEVPVDAANQVYGSWVGQGLLREGPLDSFLHADVGHRLQLRCGSARAPLNDNEF